MTLSSHVYFTEMLSMYLPLLNHSEGRQFWRVTWCACHIQKYQKMVTYDRSECHVTYQAPFTDISVLELRAQMCYIHTGTRKQLIIMIIIPWMLFLFLIGVCCIESKNLHVMLNCIEIYHKIVLELEFHGLHMHYKCSHQRDIQYPITRPPLTSECHPPFILSIAGKVQTNICSPFFQ